MRLGCVTAALVILLLLARAVVFSASLLRHALLRGAGTPGARSNRPQAAVNHTAPSLPPIPADRRPNAPDSRPHSSNSNDYAEYRPFQVIGRPTPHDAPPDETVARFCAANWSTLVPSACGAFNDPRGPHLAPFADADSPCALKRGQPVVLSAFDHGWRIWDHLFPRWRSALRQCSVSCVLSELGSFDSRSVRARTLHHCDPPHPPRPFPRPRTRLSCATHRPRYCRGGLGTTGGRRCASGGVGEAQSSPSERSPTGPRPSWPPSPTWMSASPRCPRCRCECCPRRNGVVPHLPHLPASPHRGGPLATTLVHPPQTHAIPFLG